MIQKGRKYLMPFVVTLALVYNKTPSVALCKSEHAEQLFCDCVLDLSPPEGRSSQKVLQVLLKMLEQNLSTAVALKATTPSAVSSQFR